MGGPPISPDCVSFLEGTDMIARLPSSRDVELLLSDRMVDEIGRALEEYDTNPFSVCPSPRPESPWQFNPGLTSTSSSSTLFSSVSSEHHQPHHAYHPFITGHLSVADNSYKQFQHGAAPDGPKTSKKKSTNSTTTKARKNSKSSLLTVAAAGSVKKAKQSSKSKAAAAPLPPYIATSNEDMALGLSTAAETAQPPKKTSSTTKKRKAKTGNDEEGAVKPQSAYKKKKAAKAELMMAPGSDGIDLFLMPPSMEAMSDDTASATSGGSSGTGTGEASTAASNAAALAASNERSRKSSSTYRGVSLCTKDSRWQARIRIRKEVVYLGRFETEEAAARRYDDAAREHHGDKALINFITPEDRALGRKSVFEQAGGKSARV